MSQLEGMTGQVITPGDEDYEIARRAMINVGSPALVLRPEHVDDVREVVAYARDNGLVLSVRGGAHSFAAFSTNDGGVVLDLSRLQDVRIIDAEQHIVRIEGGATWGVVASALAPHGLGISAGDTTSVGVGGLLLGGGIGWKVRKYGLALDNLVAAEVVTADGNLVRASADEHTDLFWGLRGGGGNFGVVTAFEVRAHPTTEVFHGAIAYPYEELASVLQAWGAAMASAPRELTTFVQVLPAFGGPRAVNVAVMYDGDDEAAADKALEPFRKLGTVLSDDVHLMPYADVLVEPPPATMLPDDFQILTTSVFAQQMTEELAAAVATGVDAVGPMMSVDIRGLGGAMADVPADATAFAHRTPQVVLWYAKLGPKADNEAAVPQLTAFAESLVPYQQGGYANFMSSRDVADVEAMYPPDTYARLAAVKATYDPRNVFSQNHNIRPA